MSDIPVPTIDEITGPTVMRKMRELIKKMCTFAQGVFDSVTEAEETVAQAVEDVGQAVETANEASESARESAQTVSTYNERLTEAESDITSLGNTKADKSTTLDGYGITDAVPIINETYATAPHRPYNSANVNDVATIGSLAENPSLIHATGSETISGNKTFTGVTTATQNFNVRKTQPRNVLFDVDNDINGGSITAGDRGFFALYDKNGILIGDIIIGINASGFGYITARVRNHDGTNTTTRLVTGS